MKHAHAAFWRELGITPWQARPGVRFPGGPMAWGAPAQEERTAPPVPLTDSSDRAACESDAHSLEGHPSSPPEIDLLLLVEARSVAERELLQRMLEAIQGLRPGIHVATTGLTEPPPKASLSLRLDGHTLPSLKDMLTDAALKRPVWQALKEAVGRLS